MTDSNVRRLPSTTGDTALDFALLGDSGPVRELRRDIAKVAPLDVTVLIEGAIGTGKRVIARAIHLASRRTRGPFVSHICTGADPLAAASAFFGHRRGAFSGATEDRVGAFDAADGGTLLLDQIGTMPLDGQGQLLRIVEERLIRRLGDTDARPIDVRLLATTDRDLATEVDAGRFRKDLLYRLRIATLRVPTLESRREDIPALACACLRQARVAHGVRVDEIEADAIEYLQTRSWPANIRELHGMIEAAALRASTPVLQLKDLAAGSVNGG